MNKARLKAHGRYSGLIRILRVLLFVLGVGAFALLGMAVTLRSQAQSGAAEPPWAEPVNISLSGAATQPVLAVANDGIIHSLWWDAIDGEQYARTAGITETRWLAPATFEQIIGNKKVDDKTGEVLIFLPPHGVHLQAGANGDMHAFWFDFKNTLQTALLGTRGLGGITLLAGAASAMDAYTDISGTIHLAYARSLNLAGSPSGLYYRQTTAFGWREPTLVYDSPYFRTAKPEEMNLSIAGDASGKILAAWEDTRLGASYVRSADNGATWSAPEVLSGTLNGTVSRPAVGAAPGGEFIVVWRDTNAGGCGLTQRRSSDGGATWGAPELILTDLTRCPDGLLLRPGGDGRLWLIATPAPAPEASKTASAAGTASAQTFSVLAAWDGKSWSLPLDVNLVVGKTAFGKSDSLGCLTFALGGPSVALLGCDTGGDLWVARNAAPLDQLLPRTKSSWSAPETLSQNDANVQAQAQGVQNSVVAPEGLPAVTADEKGNLYAMWSQSASADATAPGVALYAATRVDGRWSRGNLVLRSPVPTSTLSSLTTQTTPKAEMPALAADGLGHVHAVWSGGASGRIYYSSALVRDVTSAQGWAQPIALPAPSPVGSWPQIVADPRGQTLYVLYAVPYNEQRGIWFVRSDDEGDTWSKPALVFDAGAAGWNSASKPRLALDPVTNVLHAVWLRDALPGDATPQAVAYARSTDGGLTWSAALQVATGDLDWPQVAVAAPQQVYVLWQLARSQRQPDDPAPYELWGQYSPNAGSPVASWSDAERVPGFEAISGPAGLAPDGAGRLVLVAHGSSKTGGTAELHVAQWDGKTWNAGEGDSMGQKPRQGNGAVAAPIAQTGQLQVILRAWQLRADGNGQFNILAAERAISTTASLQPVPVFTPVPTLTPLPTKLPPPTVTPRAQIPDVNVPPASASGPLGSLQPLLIGGALAIVIVGGVFGLMLSFSRGRRR